MYILDDRNAGCGLTSTTITASKPTPDVTPYELHSHDGVSRVAAGKPFRDIPSCTSFRLPPRSQTLTGPLKAHSNDNTKQCGMRIKYGDCANHFAAIHDIKNSFAVFSEGAGEDPTQTQTQVETPEGGRING
ncbi:hypothetical protein EDC04DRAFT_2604228 [Pisolithus marmoratus]|nr:hypothetical protein EDC04DRAFT_2604228 [Pisolithus marmoratus]